MSYLGSWKIDDVLTFYANTHRFDTGAATDADAVPAYRVYEDETGTPILTGTMTLLDSANTAGFYSEQITLSAANGFEKGRQYVIYISAAVNVVTGATHHTLQIEAEVDANTVSGTVTVASLNAGTITAAAIATGAVDADALATDAANEIADAVLDRDMSTGTDSGSTTVRTPRQALRALRNRGAISAGTLTVYKEDDATASWTAAVTTAASNPISEVNPAGP